MNHLIIFSRYPVPGKTKTRLIPALGRIGAADFQRKMTESIIKASKHIVSNNEMGFELCLEGGTAKQIRAWLGRDLSFSFQAPGELGNRMRFAFEQAFRKGYSKVLLIGSDIPGITSRYMGKAFDLLKECDLVLGPAHDGGYCLIGMKALADVFEGVAWGTDSVLNQTLDTARGLGLKVGLLNPLNDMDTMDDLNQRLNGAIQKMPYVSVVIPALNEASNIESAIQSALDEDAEVIVIDGGSSDNTAKRAIAAGARVETGPRGRWSQQNFGAQTAKGEVLLFLHADTTLPDGYASNIFELFMDKEIVGGAFQFKTDWDRPMMKVVEYVANLRSRYLKLPYGDQGLFVRRSVFETIGGFPDVPIAEDFLFVQIVKRKGRIRTVPSTVMTSARRWRRLGVVHTTLINQLMVFGCIVGIPRRMLRWLYELDKRG